MAKKSFWKKGIGKGIKFVLKHALFFTLAGLTALFLIYYNVLNIRAALPGGYHSSPELTTTSEFLWFFIAGLMYILVSIIKKLLFKKNKKRKKR